MEDPYRDHRPPPGGRVRPADRPEFGPLEVYEVRERFGLPQTQFARLIGISVETLRNWERGRRRPVGTSRALLRIAAAHPNVVASVLAGARVMWSPEEEQSWEPIEVVKARARARAARADAERAEAAERRAKEASEAEPLIGDLQKQFDEPE